MKRVIELKVPVQEMKDGELRTIKEMIFDGRFRGRHLRMLPDSFFDQEKSGIVERPEEYFLLIADLTGHPLSVIEDLDVLSGDLENVMSVLTDFLSDGPETKEKSRESSGE